MLSKLNTMTGMCLQKQMARGNWHAVAAASPSKFRQNALTHIALRHFGGK